MLNKDYEPKMYMSTKDMPIKEWEEARRDSLGGSDMSVVMGVNPYGRTRKELFFDKTRRKPVDESEDRSKDIIFGAGHFLEEMVANLFSEQTALETYEIKAMFEHPLYPFIRADIDRFYRYKGTKTPLGILECKTTNEFNRDWSDDRIPIQYCCQLATYLSVLNMDNAHISCLFIPEIVRVIAGVLYQMKKLFGKLPKTVLGDLKDQLMSVSDSETELYLPTLLKAMDGEFLLPKHLLADTSSAIGKKFITREYTRDEVFEEAMLSEATDFWTNYVQKGIEPPFTEEASACISTIEKYYAPKTPSTTPVVTKIVTEEMEENIKKIKMLRSKSAAFTKKASELDKEVEKLSIPFIEALKSDGGKQITFMKDTDVLAVGKYESRESTRTDVKKIKTAHPSIYDTLITDGFIKTSMSKPKFKLTGGVL